MFQTTLFTDLKIPYVFEIAKIQLALHKNYFISELLFVTIPGNPNKTQEAVVSTNIIKNVNMSLRDLYIYFICHSAYFLNLSVVLIFLLFCNNRSIKNLFNLFYYQIL